jgi:hypothetical protein
LPGGAGGLQFAAMTERGFGFLELLTDHAAENILLICRAQRLRREMDAALGKLGEVGFVRALREEFVGVL